MNREQQIIGITRRKVAQGFSAEEQYAALNAAREKRKRKRAKNVEQMMSGGVKQVLILGR